MEGSTYQIAEKISKLYQEAYGVYLPLVEDVCSRKVSGDEKILGLYKKACRRYLDVYPRCIKYYIEVYREVWEDEGELEHDL